MERFTWFYDAILAHIARIKAAIISILHSIPALGRLSDSQLEWAFIGMIFIIAIFVIIPLIKYSFKIAIGAVAIAAAITCITSFSFWGLLPFTGLGVAVVMFSNKLQMG